jgi:hypothetical protein
MLNLPKNFAYNINKTMEQHSIRLSFTGEFTNELISVLLGMAKGTVKMGAFQKKVYNIMIESLENLVRHASKSGIIPYPAIFLLAQDEEFHYISTGNKIHKQEIADLKNRIDKANSCNKAELRQWYNQVLMDGKIPSDNTGAGLGLIDIAMKSGNPLVYEFIDMSENHSFFVLKVRVNNKLN